MHFISTCNMVQYMDYRMNTIIVGEFSFMWNYWNWNHYITMINSLSWRPHFCTLKATTDSATGLKFVATAHPQVPKIFSTEADCSGGLIKIEIRGFKEVGGVEIEEKKGSIKTGTYRRFTKDWEIRTTSTYEA